MLEQKQPHNDLTDERVPFWLCWLGAISEIEIDPHADFSADYDLEYPEPAMYPDCCPYCGRDLDDGYNTEEQNIPGVECAGCGEFIPDDIEED